MMHYRPRSYSINDFLAWHERQELILQPKFQRRDNWEPKAKSHLIDTILRGLPVPLIFLTEEVDVKRKVTIRNVVDGQQRLRAVLSYIANDFTVLPVHSEMYGDLPFSALPPEVQADFMTYEFSVVLLQGATEPDILGIFARLNSYAQKLNEQEKLNAEFFGYFKQLVYTISHEQYGFWRQNSIFRDNQIARMEEAQLVTELLVSMIYGIQNRREKIREAYKEYDDQFVQRQEYHTRWDSVLDSISLIFEDSLKGTMYKGKALFSSLFLALYDLKFGLPNHRSVFERRQRRLTKAQATAILRELCALELLVKQDSTIKRTIALQKALKSSTADAAQRKRRVELLSQAIDFALKHV